MSEATTYTPKKGDRVRVTYVYEGVVEQAATSGVAILDDKQQFRFEHHASGSTIEKLEDPIPPEPEWMNGDVIKVPSTFYGPRIVARINGEWRFTDIGDKAGPHLIGNHWPDIEILYKADAA